jgi:hypothetical protein
MSGSGISESQLNLANPSEQYYSVPFFAPKIFSTLWGWLQCLDNLIRSMLIEILSTMLRRFKNSLVQIDGQTIEICT